MLLLHMLALSWRPAVVTSPATFVSYPAFAVRCLTLAMSGSEGSEGSEGSDDSNDEECSKQPLLDQLADASWDMFVMPGEYANSRYDRPLEPTATPPKSSTFNWGGSQDERDDALRLPTGVPSAERLSAPISPPRRLWFELPGRGVSEDISMLSRSFTLIAFIISAAVLAAVFEGGLPAPGLPAAQPAREGALVEPEDSRSSSSRSLRMEQERFIRARVAERARLNGAI